MIILLLSTELLNEMVRFEVCRVGGSETLILINKPKRGERVIVWYCSFFSFNSFGKTHHRGKLRKSILWEKRKVWVFL